MKTVADILDRALKTLSVAGKILSWQWPHRSNEQCQEAMEDVDGKRLAYSSAGTTVFEKKIEWDARLEDLHGFTTRVARFGRLQFNGHRAKAFDFVKPDAKSRANIVAAGERLAVLWDKLDADWVPHEDATRSGLEELLEQCTTNRRVSLEADVDELLAGGELDEAAAALDADCVAWYAAATAMFGEGTAKGEFIRDSIPTAPAQPAPRKAVITKITSGPEGTVRLDCEARHGTRLTLLQRAPGEKEFKAVAETKEKSITLTGLAAGKHAFKVFASNSRGDGPASAEATVTITAARAA